MKANEFVKKFGWEHSIEAVKNMPKDWDYCCLRIPDFEFQKHVSCIADCVDMDDLKLLVDSWSLVELCGGLEVAKNLDPDFLTGWVESVNKAILDMESCQ